MNNFILTLTLFAAIFGQFRACFSRNITLYSGSSQTGDVVCTIDLTYKIENEFINFDEDRYRKCIGNTASSMRICDVHSLSQFGIYSSDIGSTTDGNSYMLIYVTKSIEFCYNGIVSFELGFSDNFVTANYYGNNDKNGLDGHVNGLNISLSNMSTPNPTHYPTFPTNYPTKSPTSRHLYDILFFNTQQYNIVLDSNGNRANHFSYALASHTWYYQGKDSNGNKFWSRDETSSQSSMDLYYDTINNKLKCGYINGSMDSSLQCICNIDNNKDPIDCNGEWFVRNETISWIQLTAMNVYYYQAIENCEVSKYINYDIAESVCIANQTGNYGTEMDGKYDYNECYNGFPQYSMVNGDGLTQTIQYSHGINQIEGYSGGWAIFGDCYGTDFLSCNKNLRISKNGNPYLDTYIQITDCSDA